MKHRILLIGYYGKGNAGDEWIKEKTEKIIKLNFPNAEILTSKSDFLSATMLLYGGGGLLQNKTSNRSLLYYNIWIILATLLNKPVYMIGQGFGPISGRFYTWLTKACLKQVKAISVRDTDSYNFAMSAGIKPSKCILAPDLAFYDSIFMQTYTKNQKIWLNLRPWKHTPKNWQEICKTLQNNASEFLACSAEDLMYSGNLATTNLLSQIKNPRIEKPYILIAMRFHACVWAALQGIPFVAIVYDDKVEHLAKKLEQPFIRLSQTSPSHSEINAQIKEISINHQLYQTKIRKNLTPILEAAMQHDKLFGL